MTHPIHNNKQKISRAFIWEKLKNLKWQDKIQFMTIFTGIIALFTYLSYRSIEDSGKLQNRAFISVDAPVYPEISVGFTDAGDTGIDIIVLNILNTGKTPAYDVRVRCESNSDTSEIENIDKLPIHNMGCIGSSGVHQEIRVKPIKYVSAKDFFRETKKLFVYGVVYYEDFYKDKHHVDFFYYLIPEMDYKNTNYSTKYMLLNSKGIGVQAMETHNGTDR
ncbi:MAG TPA: hypothetical protein VK806_13665 [Bacteroidia bacterium]|jgi:hypothetical protein|nr:hypothetical protein [Bacteroidia bacterium]